jgi:hypothetical protein
LLAGDVEGGVVLLARSLRRFHHQEATVFYRMSRLHFDADRFDELLAWAESVKPRVEEIDGLVFADIARTGSGEGMILAGYERESDFVAARDTVAWALRRDGRVSDRPPTRPHRFV